MLAHADPLDIVLAQRIKKLDRQSILPEFLTVL